MCACIVVASTAIVRTISGRFVHVVSRMFYAKGSYYLYIAMKRMRIYSGSHLASCLKKSSMLFVSLAMQRMCKLPALPGLASTKLVPFSTVIAVLSHIYMAIVTGRLCAVRLV